MLAENKRKGVHIVVLTSCMISHRYQTVHIGGLLTYTKCSERKEDERNCQTESYFSWEIIQWSSSIKSDISIGW